MVRRFKVDGREFLQSEEVILETRFLNAGAITSQNQTTLSIYASKNQVFDGSDVAVKNFLLRSLKAGESVSSGSLKFNLPSALSGEYYLIAVIDPEDELEESNEDNNRAVSELPIKIHAGASVRLGGRVTDVLGKGISGVEILGFSKEIKTDDNGYYSVRVPLNWSGELKAEKSNYFFTNLDKTVQVYNIIEATADRTNLGFIGLNTYDLAKKIANTAYAIASSFSLRLDIEHKIVKNLKIPGKALEIMNEAKDYYEILTAQETNSTSLNQIIKGFKLMQKATKVAGPIGSILKPYFYMGAELVKKIGDLQDLIWKSYGQANLNLILSGDHIAKFGIELKINKTRLLRDKKFNGNEFDDYVDGVLMLRLGKDAQPQFLNLKKTVHKDHLIFELAEFGNPGNDFKLFLLLNWYNGYSSKPIRKIYIPLERPFADIKTRGGWTFGELKFEIALKTKKDGNFSESTIETLQIQKR